MEDHDSLGNRHMLLRIKSFIIKILEKRNVLKCQHFVGSSSKFVIMSSNEKYIALINRTYLALKYANPIQFYILKDTNLLFFLKKKEIAISKITNAGKIHVSYLDLSS